MFKKSFFYMLVGFSSLSGSSAVFAAGSWDFDGMERNSNTASTLAISDITGEEHETDLTELSEANSPRTPAGAERHHYTESQNPRIRSHSETAEYDMAEGLEEALASLSLSPATSISSSDTGRPRDFEEFPYVKPSSDACSEGYWPAPQDEAFEQFPYVTPRSYARSDGSWTPNTEDEAECWDTQTCPGPLGWLDRTPQRTG